MNYGYEWIKALAVETGRKFTDLLVLARKNDPFFAGSPAKRRDGEWFEAIWEQFKFGNGVHVRRCHYRVVSADEPPLCPNGMPYTNTDECWQFLSEASKSSRYLDLVDPAAFVDRRNPDPKIYAASRQWPAEPRCVNAEALWPSWSLPTMWIQLDSSLPLPRPFVGGYDYQVADQRYYLSVWVEKSTVDDILEPLCREYAIDLVTGVGYQSITSVITMLRQRANVLGKPTRIFYISDFDPAGEHMPVAVARQIEFWRRKYAPDEEIKLMPLALTKAQVIEYRLPRIPIKESDLCRKDFQNRHGEGAVELDALEGLHPGELARMVRAAIEPYFDAEIEEQLADADRQAEDEVAEAWKELVEPEAEELKAIKRDADAIARKHQPAATKLQKSFEADMKPVEERMAAVRQALKQKAGEFEITLPERPEAAEADVNESDWLFDSSRDYLTQLEHYRRYKGSKESA